MTSKECNLRICEDHLTKVSRTFALNIRVLKGDVYRGLLLAYLLCRIADTLEDDPSFSFDLKIDYLSFYASLFPPSSDWRSQTGHFMDMLSFGRKSSDTLLVGDTDCVLSEFIKLSPAYISIISHHVREMALGMAEFQEKRSRNGIICLDDKEELERYCYYVAGTVGVMITSLFAEGASSMPAGLKERLYSRSVAFGTGLQLTNIAKDFFSDFGRGWCYVPRSFFESESIAPDMHLLQCNQKALLGVFRRLISLALENLDEALLYTLDIPRSQVRYRLFCLWPLFMAVETLARLSEEKESLLCGRTIKISRREVKKILFYTTMTVMSDHCLQAIYRRIRMKVAAFIPHN